MRNFKMLALGAVLCWAVACARTEAWGQSPDNFFQSDFKDNFDIDDVLKLDELFRAEDIEDKQKPCEEGGNEVCEKINKVCKDNTEDGTSECGDCITGYSKRDGEDACIRDNCENFGTASCAKSHKNCEDVTNGYECKGCNEGYLEKEGTTDCIPKPCEDGGNAICEKLNKICKNIDGGTSVCGDCKGGFLKKDGTDDCLENTCKNFGNVFCGNAHKVCEDDIGGYKCGKCSEGFEKKEGSNDCIQNSCENFGHVMCGESHQVCSDKEEGGYNCGNCLEGYFKKEETGSVCIQKPCTEGGSAICDKLNKTCSEIKEEGSSKCEECKTGFSKKDGTDNCIKNNCKNFGTAFCGKSHKACTDKDVLYECGGCLEGFEKKEKSDECIANSCENFGNGICLKSHKLCKDKTGGYDCKECIKGFAKKEGSEDCIENTCENFGNKVCDTVHKICNNTEGGYKCGNCKDAFVKKEGEDVCIKKTCPNFGNAFCDKLHKQCEDKDGGYKCGSCKDGFMKKEGTEDCIKKTCENAGNKECGAEHKICANKDDGSYSCTNCIEGYAKKAGSDVCLKESCDPENNKCKYNGTCVNKLCDCLSGFSGDLCEKIYECEEGKFKLCKGDKGNCDFYAEIGKVDCRCSDDKKYDEELKYCRSKCTDNAECKNGKCEKGVCKCNNGYIGDDCSKIDGCDELKDKCEKASSNCELNPTTFKGHCVCRDSNYIFRDDKCIAKWCEPDPCKGGAQCKFENGLGTCKCADKKYYDYKKNECKDLDKCLKESCGKNKKCNSQNGKCECIPGFETDGDNCKPNACKSSPCYTGAECDETDKPNVVKCTCKGSEIYKQAKCHDATCFLLSQNCSSCPTGMKLENGVCKYDEGKECKKDCGYGWCVKDGDKEKCECKDERFAKNSAGVCVLHEAACASRKIDSDDPKKCNCTTDNNMYKLASNGITCERKSCADKDVQDECRSINAQCQDTWKNSTKAYDCVCDNGYVKHSETGVCTDPCKDKKAMSKCSINKQTCFLSNSKNEVSCKCSPAFTLKSENKRCEPSDNAVDYMLLNLPVESGQYVKDGSVDIVKLSKDVIDAMEESFSKQEIESAVLYKYKLSSDNIVLCDVWLQFKPDATKNVARWDQQKIPEDKVTILPPALKLSTAKVHEVKSDKMTFCSDAVRGVHCGKNTQCDGKKCSCSSGYKVIEATRMHYGDYETVHCEDINECEEGLHECSENTTCSNTPGDYFCKCKDGFKKSEGSPNAENKDACIDLCSPNPCGKGKCEKKKNVVDCTCEPGYGGSFCNREDANFKRASKNTVVVGAVLGTILGVIVVLFVFYVVRQRKNSYSEDFTPAPRLDNAEMVERRPMRGVTNRAYQ